MEDYKKFVEDYEQEHDDDYSEFCGGFWFPQIQLEIDEKSGEIQLMHCDYSRCNYVLISRIKPNKGLLINELCKIINTEYLLLIEEKNGTFLIKTKTICDKECRNYNHGEWIVVGEIIPENDIQYKYFCIKFQEEDLFNKTSYSWTLEDFGDECDVFKKDDESGFEVYRDSTIMSHKIGEIITHNKLQFRELCIRMDEYYENPIKEKWDDGRGNICNIDGWGGYEYEPDELDIVANLSEFRNHSPWKRDVEKFRRERVGAIYTLEEFENSIEDLVKGGVESCYDSFDENDPDMDEEEKKEILAEKKEFIEKERKRLKDIVKELDSIDDEWDVSVVDDRVYVVSMIARY